MKRFLSILLVAVMMVSLASCKKKPVDVQEEGQQVEQPKIEGTFYERMTKSKSRPVAVMIDNDSWEARPQSGLEDAFAIYEIMVEGVSTRLMALFLDADTEKIGPVRSSRHYFLDYALEHDAIYTHCGFSPYAQKDIPALGVNNINEMVTNNGANFFRDNKKVAPHNLYAVATELIKTAGKLGYKTQTEKERVFSYKEETGELTDGTPATQLLLSYNSAYEVSYTYNAETKLYERYINEKEHKSESSGEILTAENIIVYRVENYTVDDVGRQNLENIGSGDGVYVTEGKQINIKWSKNSRTGKTEYLTESGEPLVINPGNTFVQIMPVSSEIIIK